MQTIDAGAEAEAGAISGAKVGCKPDFIAETASEPLSLVSMVKAAAKQLPINSYGLPDGIYRPDLLPTLSSANSSLEEIGSNLVGEPPTNEQLSIGSDKQLSIDFGLTFQPDSIEAALPNELLGGVQAATQSQLACAFYPLCYAEGFPAQEDGRPFWGQLEFEPDEPFEAFEAYLAQGQLGVRQLFLLASTQDALTGRSCFPAHADNQTNQTNQPDSISTSMRLQALQEYFHLYYWEWRVKAFDMFNTIAKKQQRLARAMQVEDDHYLVAERLNSIALSYIDDDPDSEFMQLMTPRVALEMLKSGTVLQRISAGLPANGPSPNQKADPNGVGASIEVQLRTIAQQNGVTEQASHDNTSTLREVLQSPETAALAQELIIKMSTPQANLNPSS